MGDQQWIVAGMGRHRLDSSTRWVKGEIRRHRVANEDHCQQCQRHHPGSAEQRSPRCQTMIIGYGVLRLSSSVDMPPSMVITAGYAH